MATQLVSRRCATPATPRSAGCRLTLRPVTARRGVVRVQAAKGKDSDDAMAGAIRTASGLVDKAADFVPETVPRPAAKAGVAIAGVMVVFWLLQKVISGVVTLALFAGVGYYFLTQSGKGDDAVDVTPSSSSGKKGGSGGGKDLDDPLSEARRIMDKYK